MCWKKVNKISTAHWLFLGERRDAGHLAQPHDDLDGLPAGRHVAQPNAAHHHPDAGLDEVGAQPASIVNFAQGLDNKKKDWFGPQILSSHD